MDEMTMREARYCAGCGCPKEQGMMVCWNCFKYRDDVCPLKYFPGTVNEWLRLIDSKRGICNE